MDKARDYEGKSSSAQIYANILWVREKIFKFLKILQIIQQVLLGQILHFWKITTGKSYLILL